MGFSDISHSHAFNAPWFLKHVDPLDGVGQSVGRVYDSNTWTGPRRLYKPRLYDFAEEWKPGINWLDSPCNSFPSGRADYWRFEDSPPPLRQSRRFVTFGQCAFNALALHEHNTPDEDCDRRRQAAVFTPPRPRTRADSKAKDSKDGFVDDDRPIEIFCESISEPKALCTTRFSVHYRTELPYECSTSGSRLDIRQAESLRPHDGPFHFLLVEDSPHHISGEIFDFSGHVVYNRSRGRDEGTRLAEEVVSWHLDCISSVVLDRLAEDIRELCAYASTLVRNQLRFHN